MTSETTKTKPELSGDAPASWPPKAHLIRRKDHPPKEGTIALCGAKMMGIDLDGASVNKVCPKCIDVYRREKA